MTFKIAFFDKKKIPKHVEKHMALTQVLFANNPCSSTVLIGTDNDF